MTATFTYTSDFHNEFLTETSRLLHRRFIWCIAATLVILLAHLAGHAAVGMTLSGWSLAALVLLGAMDVAVCGGLLAYTFRSRPRRERLIRLSSWFFIFSGASCIAAARLGHIAGFPATIALLYILATALLPWTPRQAGTPIAVVLAMNTVVILVGTGVSSIGGWVLICLSVFTAGPGLLIAWVKQTRRTETFKLRFLQSRYGQMRRELVYARRIHESLFPPPRRGGAVQFDYRYEPMRQIGGDYLYASFAGRDGREDRFNVVLVDVTGHGIPAALTVNRLSGEVERLYAESPEARPGDVLRALNRYVHLTMAHHSVYATAICFTIDLKNDRIEYASGGHPPAFLRQADGRVEQLDSTTFVLGACADADFDPASRGRAFAPGDVLIACTDGAIECRDHAGRMLGTMGLLRAVSTGAPALDGGWAQSILGAVEAHRAGPPEDDTLVVEVARPLRTAPFPSHAPAARQSAVVAR
jgi:serine phosphatase RsbU (regulator of sigma subunit)